MTTRKSYQAKYFQENKEKILAKRKARKQREREAGQGQLFSESAAVPAKFGQQTISTYQSANKSSISNVHEMFPVKCQDDSAYAMVEGITKGPAEFVASPSRITQLHSTLRPRGNSSDISQPDSAPVDPREVDLPAVEPEEQSPVDLFDVDSPKVDQDNGRAFVIGERGRRPLSHLFISAGILLLLGANTFFLVAEQLSLYESLGYGFRMALLISVLTECLLISLSLLTSWTSSWLWKPLLLTGCLLTVAVVVNILDSSVQHRVSVAAEKAGKAERLKKRIASLEKLEGTALAIIAKYDPEVYPTKVNGMMAKLEAQGPEGYSRRLREANDELDKISVAGSGNAEALVWQRRVAMLCNLLLSGFLGFLWTSRKRSSVISRIVQGIWAYCRRPSQPC